MAKPVNRKKFLDLQEREMRFRNETEDPLVKCVFCQQMLPKNYQEIQAHVDAFHKEKREKPPTKAEAIAADGHAVSMTKDWTKERLRNRRVAY